MKRITRSSRSILAYRGIRNTGNNELKDGLVLGLARLIEAKGLNQKRAADRIGMERPDLCKILGGKFTVSIERLLNIAQALGSDIEIKVKAHPRRRRHGRISLVIA
jgi:predicted XRE-type DNA-binding protein